MSNSHIALITGAKRGVGNAIANSFRKKNVMVIITSRSFDFNPTLKFTNSVIEQYLDVTSIESIKNFFTWYSSLNAPIHYLVNNAGVGVFKSLDKIDISEWRSIIDTNLTGSFFVLKYAYPFLKNANGAKVVNIGSIAENYYLKENGAYAASKLGLKALSRAINEDWEGDNIFCTHVILGAVATDIWKKRKDFFKKDMLCVNQVSDLIVDSVMSSQNIRLDTLEIFPTKGLL
ncbi:MAG: oxidoreductase [uncultured bacterium]|nr:MAG: oxidoreductase [uncultured bacterium]OGT33553.1 MAG: hypothetical protein A3C44_01535 [Gammaproteobacteria bacterium RIFCSPHIGHO2_02_FULL_39_13]OGT49568.1 MAG: hypothetical protein A3E53_00280 [Gammaproteobacteria bacterium RIFCSPHIGHO2_12_FULL_39_24]